MYGHSDSKESTTTLKKFYATTNRKKICKTLAKRHQMLQCLLSTSEDLYDISAVTGRTKLVKLNLLPQEVALSLHTTSDNSEEIYIATSLKFRGVKYSVGLCVAVGMEGDLVQYGCIQSYFVIDDIPYFHLSLLKTIDYSAHFHSFVVENGSSAYLCRVTDLSDPCYSSLLGNRLVHLGISKQQHLYFRTKNLI